MQHHDFYVNMVDKFMSGWGQAKNGRSILVIRCKSEAQASAAYWAAIARREMKSVCIARRPRSVNPNDQLRIVDFADLGPVWKYHMREVA